MRRKITDQNYAARIDRVAAYIGANLEAPLDLQRLAEVACFSPYHFHRIYRLTMGETPDQTVRRLRLHRAAVGLQQSDMPLSKIASAAGYGSLEAFTRAFSATYGVSPTTFRAQRTHHGQPPHAPEIIDMYQVTEKQIDALRLAGLTHHGAYNDIGTVFDLVFAWAGARGLIGPATQAVGIFFDDPETKPASALRSFAGITVAADVAGEGAIEISIVEAGPVASLIHQGPYADLPAAYRYFYGEWLPTSGREPADRPCFEIYLNNPRELPPTEWRTEIFLPLAA